jgi:hypothetical protein
LPDILALLPISLAELRVTPKALRIRQRGKRPILYRSLTISIAFGGVTLSELVHYSEKTAETVTKKSKIRYDLLFDGKGSHSRKLFQSAGNVHTASLRGPKRK